MESSKTSMFFSSKVKGHPMICPWKHRREEEVQILPFRRLGARGGGWVLFNSCIWKYYPLSRLSPANTKEIGTEYQNSWQLFQNEYIVLSEHKFNTVILRADCVNERLPFRYVMIITEGKYMDKPNLG